MADDPHATDYDFTSEKYGTKNPISRVLVEGFYGGVSRLLARAAPQSVLEVGCGEGYSTARVRALVTPTTRVAASDVEARLVAAARRQNPDIEVIQESAYALTHEDDSFDVVVCMEVLEHLERPADALAELCRVARRYVLLTVPREPLWRAMNVARLKYLGQLGNTPGHLQHWSQAGFLKFVGQLAEPVAVRKPVPWTQVLARVRRPANG